MNSLARIGKILGISTVSLMLTVLLVAVLAGRAQASVPVHTTVASGSSDNGYILRFDPVITQFEVITLPVVAAQSRRPEGVAIVGNDIWYTDPGADKVGRLTYTGTNNYTITEFSVPTGSEPFDIVANGGYLWFTAKGSDWIGRLEISTTNVVSFPLASGSAPWRIDVGSDGSVWFTEREANKLGRLIVTSTLEYALIEYDIPDVDSKPEGITVENSSGSDLVWFGETAPAGSTKIVRFNPLQLPPSDFATISIIPGAGYPVNLISQGNQLWTAERLGNNVSLIFFSTLGSIKQNQVPTANSYPYDVALDPSFDVWFTEQMGQKLGKRIQSTGQFQEFMIPSDLGSMWLRGIAVDTAQEKIWFAGFNIAQIYLPLLVKG